MKQPATDRKSEHPNQNTGIVILAVILFVIMTIFLLAAMITNSDTPTGPVRTVQGQLYKKSYYPASQETGMSMVGKIAVPSNRDVPEHWIAQVHYEKRVNDCPMTKNQYETLARYAPLQISLQKRRGKEVCIALKAS